VCLWQARSPRAIAFAGFRHAHLHRARTAHPVRPGDLDEIYGEHGAGPLQFSAVDRPTTRLSTPYLYGLSHARDAVRAALRHGWEKAVLYGFLVKRRLGADFTATMRRSRSSRIRVVITKGSLLQQILTAVPEYSPSD